MNTTQAKQIPLKSYLKKINIQPVKEHNSQAWYLSPFRAEKTASFKIDAQKNIFYDHGLGWGGNILDFMMKYHNCTLSEALKILDNNSFSFHQQEIFEKQPIDIPSEENNKPHIVKISPCIKHPALREYMKYRGLKNYDNCILLFEIHYKVQERAYFGLGFKNDSGGYEIRNKYSKTSISKKDITHIKNGSKILRVFEGFMDYLTFLEINKMPDSDYLILNSVSMISKVLPLILKSECTCEKCQYVAAEIYLDNDHAGDIATEKIKENFSLVFDKRGIYKDHKDLNEWHMNSILV
jgi:CHC2 zinc finger/Toprim-like